MDEPIKFAYTMYRPHERVPAPSGGDEVTEQSHKAECDIHTILKQFQRTGILTHINERQPQFLDLPDGIDYQQSLHLLQHAQDAFAALPSKVRDRFDNDPGQFLAAFQDPGMAGELRDLGLLKPVPPPDPLTTQEDPNKPE